MKSPELQTALDANLVVTSNAIAIVANTILAIAGNEISNSIDGKTVNSATLENAVAAKIFSKLTPYMGVQ